MSPVNTKTSRRATIRSWVSLYLTETKEETSNPDGGSWELARRIANFVGSKGEWIKVYEAAEILHTDYGVPMSGGDND